MKKILVLLLMAGLTGCTGDELCWIAFCTEQTHIQMDYTSHRDLCRQLAQLKAEEFPDKSADSDPKARLTALFSECMSEKGWAVPGGEKKPEPTGPVTKPVQTPQMPQDSPEYRQQRAAECSFARRDAPYSLTARNRAQACDAECADLSALAPESPRPAACP